MILYFQAYYSDLRDRSSGPSAVLKDPNDSFDPSDTSKSYYKTIGLFLKSIFDFNLFTTDCASSFAEYIKLKLRNPNLDDASVVLISFYILYTFYGISEPTCLLRRFSWKLSFSFSLLEKLSK